MNAKLYGQEGKHFLFSYLDAQTLGEQFSQAEFWEYVLRPLRTKIADLDQETPLAQAYQICEENNFGTFVLERLLEEVREQDLRLIVMLDEFNEILRHPVLNCAEFFGSLRSLATRARSALAIIVATPRSLSDLSERIDQFSTHGSPYFNFLSEVPMGPLSLRDISELLRRAEQFTTKDRRFVSEVAGGHPYLVQATAAALWEAYQDKVRDPVERWRVAGESLYDEAEMTIGNTWGQWPPPMRQAITAVALAQIPTLLSEREFLVERFIRDIRDFRPELRELKRRGFTQEDDSIPGGWRVRPGVFLWWLADELTRTVRSQEAFDDWLRGEVLEGALTRKEKQQLGQVARQTMDMVKGGVSALIEAAAVGIGSGLST
jgi:hypothetical protein